jgi:hypothetical protein
MNNKTKGLSLAALSILSALIYTTINLQPVQATVQSEQGAAQFTPGHIFKGEEGSQGAAQFTPGHLQGRLPGGGCDAPDFAPGHLFKLPMSPGGQ